MHCSLRGNAIGLFLRFHAVRHQVTIPVFANQSPRHGLPALAHFFFVWCTYSLCGLPRADPPPAMQDTLRTRQCYPCDCDCLCHCCCIFQMQTARPRGSCLTRHQHLRRQWDSAHAIVSMLHSSTCKNHVKHLVLCDRIDAVLKKYHAFKASVCICNKPAKEIVTTYSFSPYLVNEQILFASTNYDRHLVAEVHKSTVSEK